MGLGSNLGDRRGNLTQALKLLSRHALALGRVSPVVESPALLPAGSLPEWDRPYLNIAVQCETDASPRTVRGWTETIERRLGRTPGPRWSPRPMDIDILLWGDRQLRTESLTIPHAGLRERNFVLTPLVALEPRLVPPGTNGATLLECSRRLPDHIPLWMGIVNMTPDSFSDGGRFLGWESIEPHVTAMLESGVHVIDVGGESTRPGASPLDSDREWARVGPVLERLIELRGDSPLGPLISVDTYRPATARRALALGVDIINDVSGLADPRMIELARGSSADWIAMHQLSLPVDPGITLPPDADPFNAIEQWLSERADLWHKAGLDLNRIIVDPGIGFGKTAHQSLALLRHAGELRRHGFRVLVGHSRKSFLRHMVGDDMSARDAATASLSLDLCDQGVDILRVHDVPLNMGAHRGRALARLRANVRPEPDHAHPGEF